MAYMEIEAIVEMKRGHVCVLIRYIAQNRNTPVYSQTTSRSRRN